MAVHLNRGIRYLLTASKAGSNPAPVLILSWCCHMASQPVAVVPIRTANKNMMEGVNPCLLMKSCDGKRSGSQTVADCHRSAAVSLSQAAKKISFLKRRVYSRHSAPGRAS